MSNVVPFNFEGGDIRVVTVDNEPWFIAKDVAASLGYADTDYAIRTHCKAVQSWAGESSGQVRTLKIIPERDIYRLVLKSKLPAAMRFEEWVVGDVLPTIRKTGRYAPAPVNLGDAAALRGLLIGYTEQVIKLEHKVEVQSTKIAKDKPKVEYHDAVKASVKSQTMLQVANKYGIGRTKLFKFLKDYGVIRNDEHNPPYQRFIDSGHFEVDPKFYKDKGKFVHYTQTMVTGKGEIYIGKLLRKAGLVGSGE